MPIERFEAGPAGAPITISNTELDFISGDQAPVFNDQRFLTTYSARNPVNVVGPIQMAMYADPLADGVGSATSWFEAAPPVPLSPVAAKNIGHYCGGWGVVLDFVGSLIFFPLVGFLYNNGTGPGDVVEENGLLYASFNATNGSTEYEAILSVNEALGRWWRCQVIKTGLTFVSQLIDDAGLVVFESDPLLLPSDFIEQLAGMPFGWQASACMAGYGSIPEGIYYSTTGAWVDEISILDGEEPEPPVIVATRDTVRRRFF